MAKFIITKVGGRNSRKSKVAKERVEIRILPLIGCFLLAVGIWMAVVGTQIREEEQRAAQQADLHPSVNAESQTESELQPSERAGQEVNESPDVPAPENGMPSASS